MFKKILVTFVCAVLSFSAFAAQLTATLQSGDKLTPFYGENAFVEAYNAAADGDIITLSTGTFNKTNIAKSITIYGTYAFNGNDVNNTYLGGSNSTVTVSADNVKIEGVKFYNFCISGADNLTINRCYIVNNLSNVEATGHKYHNNTILTDCRVESYSAMSLSKNTILRKCAIGCFNDQNESSNMALIENCNINCFSYYIGFYEYVQPYAIYRNNYLRIFNGSTGAPTLSLVGPSEYHNNAFEDANTYSTNHSSYHKWTLNWASTHNDGNVIKCYGSESLGSSNFFTSDSKYGPVGHKYKPSIPTITSSKIDTETDTAGKLHVKITAEAQD